MASEVPKQYQRNSEDVQLLKFPSTKNILWDHSSHGDPYTLHISYFRNPKLCITEKVLKFAQRHLESVNPKSCGCVLVGSLIIDPDGQGVTFDVERMDPAADPNSSTSHAAGDMLIPFTVQHGVKDRGSNADDYSNALQLLKDRCSSKDPIELGNFLLTKGWCSFYTSGEKCVHHLEFDMVTMGTELKVVPIGPVPIVPTALSKNLSGPMSISHMQGVPKTGYLTMDHTRKLLLVLESDPKVVNLPLVGIWISGVSYAYNPYVWACCLRYIHNATIQDRVCSPPEPFLLLLYNPTHSKPEFYECSTDTGSSSMTFDIYSGYEAVQLSKTTSSSYPTTEIELDLVQSGSKYETFERAAELFYSKMPTNEKKVSSVETLNEDITPRLRPAPHQAKMPIMQSLVPEVSLFFGNEDTTFVPNINHPKPTQNRLKPSPPVSEISCGPVKSSLAQQQPSSQPGLIPSSTSAINEMNALRNSYNVVPSSRHLNDSDIKDQPVSVPNRNPASGLNLDSRQVRVGDSVLSSNQQQAPSSVYPQIPVYPHSLPVHSAPSAPGYQHQFHPRITGPGTRPGLCSCPNCLKALQFNNGCDPARNQPVLPVHGYPNHGPPHARMVGPHARYPNMHYHPGLQSGQPGANGIYFQHQNHPSFPIDTQHPCGGPLLAHSLPNGQLQFVNQHANTNTPIISSSKQPLMNSGLQPLSSNSSVPEPQRQLNSAPVPQVSNGVPSRVGRRSLPSVSRSDELSQDRSENAANNQASDKSGRSSDDSGLSFTPEKQSSPSNPSPKASQNDLVPDPSNILTSDVKWENIPPEIYQLLLQQDKQLKQLQAQIEILTSQQAKSLNNTEDNHVLDQVAKCNVGTNTSINCVNQIEQVSACIQTSLNSMTSSDQYNKSGSSNRSETGSSSANNGLSSANRESSHSSSGVSGNESRTPYEIRHRGKVQMNSTQREDVDLDISQGELVALMNNMHDKTIDSVQSEMIVDLPSFQSSPSRSPRSQESYSESTAFNISPRSPISASMCEQNPPDSEDESEGEDNGDNTAETDNPEYYNRLMDNIKKMLSQNTTEGSGDTVTDGYQGDVSSDPSTPLRLGKEEVDIGAHLQSFLRFDRTLKSNNDTTFIPKINYVSMFLDSDTDTSMEINAMAMKYLKDEQLTQLTKLQARNRLLQCSRQSTLLQKILKAEDDSTPNVTTLGMSPNNLTFNTKKYMEKHGLLEDGGMGESDASTPNPGLEQESYELKTNYSTMSSGSEDGPVHITQDEMTTPTAQRKAVSNRKFTPVDSKESTPTQNPYKSSDSRTPRPTHVHSRLADHRRLTPNGAHDISRDRHIAGISPKLHTMKQQEKHNNGAIGRFASPLVTPAPRQPSHSPPEHDTDRQEIRYAAESRKENEGFMNMPVNNCPKGFQQAVVHKPFVWNQYQQNDGNNEDDRILDITRLKQLPKLL